MTPEQLIEARNKHWHDAKAILDKADAEKRSLTAEEREQYDKYEAEIETLGEQIGTAERKQRAAQMDLDMRSTSGRKSSPSQVHQPRRADMDLAMRGWMQKKQRAGQYSAEEIRNFEECGLSPYSNEVRIGIGPQKRAIGITTPSAGGTFATWHNFAESLDRAMLMYGAALNLVKQLPTASGIALPIPTVDDTANEAVIVAEAGAIATTPDPTTGSVTLNAFMYSTRAILVSLQLLQDSIMPLDTLLPDLLGERWGRAINRHIVSGTGSSQPFGIFPRATASGVVVAGTTASPTFSGDNFIDLLHSVDPAYRNSPSAGFMMHDTIVQRVRKLKDNNGQYLWQPSLQMGQPDRLLGYNLFTNQAAPTLAINAKLAAFGDYKRYTWRPVSEIQMMRLDELFIMNGQVAFLGFYRGDGNLINVNAVKTLAAPST